MIHLVYGNAEVGGSETLLYRIAKFLHEKKRKDVIFHCISITDNVEKLFKTNDINVHVYNEYLNVEELGLKNGDTVVLLGFLMYVSCYNFVIKRNLKCKVILYVVHPYTLTKWAFSIKGGQFVSKVYKKFVYETSITGNIVYMDEMCINETSNYYKYDEAFKTKVHICRLPIEVYEDVIRQFETFNTRKTILTIARASYPFKGYVKGLIDICVDLFKLHPELDLFIISSGEDMLQLEEWIQSAQTKSKLPIRLIKDVDYGDLNSFYDTAYLYVGMGTTILEAVNRNLPAISVETYKYECLGKCFFSDAPNEVAVKNGDGKDLYGIIDNALNYTQREYDKLSTACKQALVDNYNIDLFYEYISKYGEVNLDDINILSKLHVLYRKLIFKARLIKWK